MYHSGVKTKHLLLRNITDTQNVSLLFSVGHSHVFVMLAKTTLQMKQWAFKVLISLPGISLCPRYFPTIDQ